jgi:hypothetical protein
MRAAVFLAFAAAAVAIGQTAKVAPVPDARALIERHLKESGIGNLPPGISQTITGKFTLIRERVSGKTLLYADSDGRFYQLLEAPKIFKIEVVNDGDMEWEMSSLSGPKVRRVGSSPGSLLRPLPSMASFWSLDRVQARTIGRDTVGASPCWDVEFIQPGNSAVPRLCFDWDTGLLVRIAGTGDDDVVFGDYRQAGPVKVPYSMDMGSGQGAIHITVEQVKAGGVPPEGAFEVPAKIQELVAKQRGNVEIKGAEDDPNRPRLKRKKK